jgi:tRNA pseudouridine38-40 synthase
MAERINKQLPDDIRCVKVFKVTNSFDGRSSCDQRTYDYLLPVKLLLPNDNPVRRSRGRCRRWRRW